MTDKQLLWTTEASVKAARTAWPHADKSAEWLAAFGANETLEKSSDTLHFHGKSLNGLCRRRHGHVIDIEFIVPDVEGDPVRTAALMATQLSEEFGEPTVESSRSTTLLSWPVDTSHVVVVIASRAQGRAAAVVAPPSFCNLVNGHTDATPSEVVDWVEAFRSDQHLWQRDAFEKAALRRRDGDGRRRHP